MHRFIPFCRIHAFLFYKGRAKEDGVGGWGFTGTESLNGKFATVFPVTLHSCGWASCLPANWYWLRYSSKNLSEETKHTSSFLTINGYQSQKSRRKYWQPYAYGWQLRNEWILRYQKTMWKYTKASNDLPSLWFGHRQMKRLFSSFEALSTTNTRYRGQKAWCLRI